MKKKKNKKKPIEQLKFSELPGELTTYFILRGLFCLAMIIGLVVFVILSKLLTVFFVLLAAVLGFIGYNLYNYYCVTHGKILVYKGYFEQKKQDSIASIKGPMSIILTPVDLEEDIKYIVPVREAFSVEKGNIVTVYSKPEDVHAKGDYAFTFDNPLLVKVTKI